MNFAEGMIFGWQFWLAIIVTAGAVWYVLRVSRKHDADHVTRPGKPRTQQRPPLRPQQRPTTPRR